ncbi:MAG: oligopeptide/dipeptide ABC transporter ATP-binding protein [Candidatus Borkfalkiaceae bacterium]|nr:oligopeptide/dipeptide ABC transporter ATP-binding protein [Christensenellaceae bacterium]
MEKKLEVKNLTISFRSPGGKVQAVRGIDFDLYKGETLAIVGESGSGKSVTNRAIIGILANNAIVESGEIIYDGKDLLKISEEDFHKIRGDKIAMIFQDPMSSLNPIMKVGRQLTEAMLLKGKASQKSARKLFNGTLAVLKANMDEIAADDAKKTQNDEKCKIFDKFCTEGTHLESNYNAIHRAAEELKVDIDDQLFLIEKKQSVDIRHLLVSVKTRLKATYHPDIVVASDELNAILAEIDKTLAEKGVIKELLPECEKALKDLSVLLEKATNRPKPNYFTLGYYMMRNPEANVDDMPIDELTAMTRKYLDDEFMLDFIDSASGALVHSREVSLKKKKAIIPEIDEVLAVLNKTDDEAELIQANATAEIAPKAEKAAEKLAAKLDEKELRLAVKRLAEKVFGAINKLEVIKNSAEYTFASSMKMALDKYFGAIKNNPKELARFEKQTKKREELVKKGKNPDWNVVPAAVLDLDAQMEQIKSILTGLKNNYLKQIEKENDFDKETETVALIDYFKEQASAFVYKVTPKIAKAKALKLLEEVGIPEPAIRYNQYPFEFSGGMRQRIVIAIALAANPDILICDEPTTALDVTIQAQILELINKLKRERNLSVIFITHDLGVVANMADRIAVMYAGKIVEHGTADDIFYDPRHPYTWALLSSMPDLDTDDKLDAIPGTPPNMIYPPKGDAFAARNKYAMEIDFEMQPPMFDVSETHKAATWLLHPNAPKIDPPKQVTDRIERMKNLAKGDRQ